MLNSSELLAMLRADVVPALGCTEPVCVALCAANAAKVLDGDLTSIEVQVNAGIYKNGMSAGIPHCTHVGLDYAAALGAFLPNPEKELELLEDIDADVLARAESLVRAGSVHVSVDREATGLYVKCRMTSSEGDSTCIVKDAHTNVVFLQKASEVLIDQQSSAGAASGRTATDELKDMTLAEIRAQVDEIPVDDLAFLTDGVTMNDELAAYSETHEAGVGIASSLRQEIGGSLLGDDFIGRLMLKVSSAAESRLDGCPLPTMSSSGAGTKGLVVITPIGETAQAVGASREQLVRALAFAHLVNHYINAHVGKLSPMCTCVIASSTAAACGIAYLLGGNDDQIGYAVRNMTGTVTGMICDGGKVGCALKVSTGTMAAVIAAITAVHNAPLRTSDGIVAESPEDCIRNMMTIGNVGMANTNDAILQIMQGPK